MTVTVYTTDSEHIYAGQIEADPLGPMPPHSTLTPPPATTGAQVAQWDGRGWEVLPAYPAPTPAPAPSQFDLDEARYRKRAAVKDDLIAYMAADNMSRVRSGTWTVADLTALLADPAVATANACMGTLSFELAAQAIASASTPLLTPAIRADWISRLQEHYYLEG